MLLKNIIYPVCLYLAGAAVAEERRVFLQDANGERLQVATLDIGADGGYSVTMNGAVFTEHFLSMRPFKCLEGPDKHWCHVPYPYAIRRDLSGDLTDLEYDFLFIWKGATEYGINMWNGVYYRLSERDGVLVGALHEMDMNELAVPPAEGNLRPIESKHLHLADPDSHWLPVMVVE